MESLTHSLSAMMSSVGIGMAKVTECQPTSSLITAGFLAVRWPSVRMEGKDEKDFLLITHHFRIRSLCKCWTFPCLDRAPPRVKRSTKNKTSHSPFVHQRICFRLEMFRFLSEIDAILTDDCRVEEQKKSHLTVKMFRFSLEKALQANQLIDHQTDPISLENC